MELSMEQLEMLIQLAANTGAVHHSIQGTLRAAPIQKRTNLVFTGHISDYVVIGTGETDFQLGNLGITRGTGAAVYLHTPRKQIAAQGKADAVGGAGDQDPPGTM